MHSENSVLTSDLSLRYASKIAGFGYLIVFMLGILANFFAFDKIIIQGNAATTANNIAANEWLFRAGIVCWLVVVTCDAIVAWALYIFFKPINKSISLLTAVFRIIFVVIFGYSLVDYFSVLQLFSGEDYLQTLTISQIQAQIMLLLHSQTVAVQISFVFFGLHLFLVGYLMIKSVSTPKIIGVVLIVASFGYLINSFGNFLSRDYGNNKTAFLIFVAVPAIISEFSFTVWLLLKGGKGKQRG